MESNLVKDLNPHFKPIVFLKTDEEVENAIQIKATGHSCLMLKIAKVIVDRETFIVSSETCNCGGAFPAFGFGTNFKTEEEIKNHAIFLASGLKCAQDKESFKEYVNAYPKALREFFIEGEHIFNNYEESFKYVNDWSSRVIDGEYAVFKPLEDLKEGEIPISVIFTLNPHELSALLILNNSINKMGESNIICNQASACQAISWEVYDKNQPVLGLVDLAGRNAIKPLLGDEYLQISFPWEHYLKLDNQSKESILQSPAWKG